MRTVLFYMIVAYCLFAGIVVAQDGTTGKSFESPESFNVSIKVDVSASMGELRPIWRFFGCDEPNYACMKDGKKLIGGLGDLKKQNVFFRSHNLLTTGDGTPALKWGSTNIYTEDENGKPIYDWTIVDRIFDTYIQGNVKPYVQIGFMPKALSIKPDPYQHRWTPTAKYDEIYTGWSYPPKDYEKWAELVYQWAKHCSEKFGPAEIDQWYWEVWNEPNIGYWRGKREDFFKLHDYAIDAVRRALPSAKVGGPDMAGSDPKFLRAFIDHCLNGENYATGKKAVPMDFVSFHAKGRPRFVGGHVEMGISNQLRDINQGFSVIASYPQLKKTPIVIGESDPDGCAACQGPQLGYRNGTMYSSYTAACFARKHELAYRHGVNLEGALTWAFEFEEQPFFAGFRVLATNGIDLPVLNVFRMMSLMGGNRVAVQSTGEVPLDAILKSGVRAAADVSALAALEKNRLGILVWHYHDEDVPGPEAKIILAINDLPISKQQAKLMHYRIDEDHSNAFSAWKKMGSPQKPTADQYAQLESAGKLSQINAPANTTIENGCATIQFTLPRQAVSLVVLEWK